MSNATWWVRGPRARVDTARRRRKHLRKGYLDTSYVLRRQRLQVGSHKATVQRSSNIIGVSLCNLMST